MLKSAFTSFPYCIATYVCLIGMAWLLIGGWKPEKPPLPTNIVQAAESSAHAYAQSIGGEVFAIQPTGSMRGTLEGGDFIVTKRDFASVKVGDVLVYQPAFKYEPNRPLAHRAVQKDSYGWIMSGDTAPVTESWARVTESNYMGTVIAVFRQSTASN